MLSKKSTDVFDLGEQVQKLQAGEDGGLEPIKGQGYGIESEGGRGTQVCPSA